jgi:ureidoglycolate hydrolase
MRCSVSGVVEGGHSFSPFGKVIDNDNNVFVTIAGGGITSHKVNAPFAKGACSDDWV